MAVQYVATTSTYTGKELSASQHSASWDSLGLVDCVHRYGDKLNYVNAGRNIVINTGMFTVGSHLGQMTSASSFTIPANSFAIIYAEYDGSSGKMGLGMTSNPQTPPNVINSDVQTYPNGKTQMLLYRILSTSNSLQISDLRKFRGKSSGIHQSMSAIFGGVPSSAMLMDFLDVGDKFLDYQRNSGTTWLKANSPSIISGDTGYFNVEVTKVSDDTMDIRVTKRRPPVGVAEVHNYYLLGRYSGNDIIWTIPDQWFSFEMDYIPYGDNGNLQSYCKGIPWALINKVRGEYERNGVTMANIALKNSTSASSTRWTGFFGTSNMYLSGTRYLLSMEFARRATDYLLSFNCYSIALTNGSINISNQSRITAVCVCDIDATVTQN